MGHISNIYDWLFMSDIFVSTSFSEGLPNSVLEAISCGLPTILSDIPPHKEIKEMGYHLEFYPTGSPKVLAKKIEEASQSRIMDLNSISAKRMGNDYVELYYKVMGVRQS